MGVWIETQLRSHYEDCIAVTPFVGVWIETSSMININEQINVTPFVGVWIETESVVNVNLGNASHPSWVCGLKHVISNG